MVSESCTPTSAPDLADDFFIANFTDNSTDPDSDAAVMDVKTAVFSIYTGDLNPPTTLYGGRLLRPIKASDEYYVSKQSIYD